MVFLFLADAVTATQADIAVDIKRADSDSKPKEPQALEEPTAPALGIVLLPKPQAHAICTVSVTNLIVAPIVVVPLSRFAFYSNRSRRCATSTFGALYHWRPLDCDNGCTVARLHWIFQRCTGVVLGCD
jgi:hypothetical protein